MNHSKDIYSAPDSKLAESVLIRPGWLTLVLIVYGIFWIFLFVAAGVKIGTMLGIVYNAILASLILPPIIGIWKLAYWGPAWGILGFLVIQVGSTVANIAFPPIMIVLPIIYFLLFVWLKRFKSKFSC